MDCFEVFIERSSSPIARAMTWSTYKHHNKIKFLIGITPQGVISFISSAWCGRVSDKYLTEHSNFLKHLLPGDLVLADRGFDISDRCYPQITCFYSWEESAICSQGYCQAL